MASRDHYFSVRPFFGHSLAATCAVLLLPVLAAVAIALLLEVSVFVLAAVTVLLAIVASVIGTMMWNRRVEASDIGFSDLMLWRWTRRRIAEKQLITGTKLLGLDPSGQPVDTVRVSPQEQLQVLRDLTAALESKDPYTHGHSQRVERHVFRTGVAMGLSQHDIDDLRKAAALHDVGKVRVPDRILRKAGELTDEERTVIEEHAVVGAWMVSSVGNADVVSAVRHHHERWDGAGYPDGLAGEDIPLYARVISVADAFDAITSTRPYRASSGREDAVGVLRAQAGVQFDPQVVDAFVAALPSRLPVATGLFVLLGGPDRLLRQLAAWLKRFGAGTLAPAAGATGAAAVVLGASVFAPHVTRPPLERASSATTSGTMSESFDVDVEESEPTEVAKPDRNKHKAKAEQDVPPVAVSRTEEAAPVERATAESPAEPSGGGDDGDGDKRHESPAVEPTPEPVKTNPNDDRDGCVDGDAGSGNDDRCGSSDAGGSAARSKSKSKK